MKKLNYIKSGKAALITLRESRKYLTKFSSSAGYLLITQNDSYLIVDSRYYEAACKLVDNCTVVLQKDVYDQINEFCRLCGVDELMLESGITCFEYSLLEKKLKVKVDVTNLLTKELEMLRACKSEKEIEYIKSAQAIAQSAFLEVLNHVKVGIREKQLAAELDYKMKLLGADGISFETIVVSGANSSKPHGVPGEKEVSAGDFVTFDFGAIYNGYHSDTTRTIAVGFVTEKMNMVYNTVLAAQNAAIAAVTKGVSAKIVDQAARNVIENSGFGKYFSHGTGHGVGIEIHEHPNISPSSNDIILTNHVITIEPGVYLPTEFGVRIEDFGAVNSDGFDNFTDLEKKLLIL